MGNKTLEKRRSAAIGRGVGVQTQIFVKEARNGELWDVEGRRFIDFAAGIAVVNTGHCHPRVVEAIKKQLDLFTHTCHQVVPYENYITLGERLNALVETGEDNQTIFVSTGAEAVENAIKIARAATRRHGVIAFQGAFHGRTFMCMALNGKVDPYQRQYGPMIAGVYHAPFPSKMSGVTVAESLKGIRQIFACDISPQDVAALIVEPVQGEGGFYPASNEFMTALRNLCDEHGIIFIADEVQTGFARTGKFLAMEHYTAKSDLTAMAKGLAGGIPLAAVTGRASLISKVSAGGLGGTFGGNPLAIAAALAVLDVIEREGLCERAITLGQRLLQKLNSLRNLAPEMCDVRGLGSMVAVEFCDSQSGAPDATFAKRIQQEAFKRNLILLSCGVHGNVIRFLHPLSVSDALFDEALEILGSTFEAVSLSRQR